MSETNGERDSQRLFKRFGLSVPIPMSFMSIDPNKTLPWLKVSDWLAYLLRRSPELLCGGHKDVSQAQHMRQEFWKKFRDFQGDHEVYKLPDLKNVIPICLHGDKGRGYGKTPMFCFSFECVFGLPRNIRSAASRAGDKRFADHGGHLDWSCAKRAREDHGMQHFNDESCPKRRKLEGALQEMPHNGKGHVFLSHFLVGAISNKVMKAHPDAVDIFFKEMAQDLGAIAREGLTVKGETYHIGLLGVKGDCEFHVECGSFERSYLNVGVKKEIPFCPECDAGSTGVPGFDFSEEPSWAQTLYRTEPWPSMPHINQYVPYSQSCPASLYRRDQFHTLKYGFLKDCGASMIIWLCDLAYFDEGSPDESLSIENRLERAYGLFKLWTIAAARSTTIRKFTKGTLHRVSTFKFPYLSGKGADVVVVLSGLVWLLPLKIGAPKEPEHVELLTAMTQTCQGALSFVGVTHSHDLFLPRTCAEFKLRCGFQLLRGYAYLASRAIDDQKHLFSLRPKLHYFHHSLLEYRQQLRQGHSEVLNYGAIFNCEANEDWIGRVCRISRRISPRLLEQRTIERYLIAAKLIFKRARLS